MRKKLLAVVFVVAVAALGIWVASTGVTPGRTDAGRSDAAGSAYDYEAHDVVVMQMGPDGSLQYELTAKKISQQPQNGLISAQDLVMHRDPPGAAPGGANRWTIRADRAELPETGDVIAIEGKVRAEGVPLNSSTPLTAFTDKLTYNLKSQALSINVPVDFTMGRNRFRCDSMSVNTKDGSVVQSNCDGTFAP